MDKHIMPWLTAPIAPPDEAAMAQAQARWDSVAKPLGSLGLLETVVVKMAGLTGNADYRIQRRAHCVFCADNGVVAQGVSQAGSDITRIMAEGLLAHNTCVCHMARSAHAEVFPMDVGMNTEVEGMPTDKTRRGTGDISLGPAMTPGQAHDAIGAGFLLAQQLIEQGYQILSTGEMGIGNTTSSSAMAAVLLGKDVEAVTGRGAGLNSDGLQHKIDVIQRAIDLNRPDAADAMDVLCKLGGFDIAAMAGVFLAGAVYRVPVLIDGLISAVSALTAVRLRPTSHGAMLASHVSAEPAAHWLLEELGLQPLITANMRLGEGTGAVAALPLLDMAFAVYHGMSTFGDMGIKSYKRPQE